MKNLTSVTKRKQKEILFSLWCSEVKITEKKAEGSLEGLKAIDRLKISTALETHNVIFSHKEEHTVKQKIK